MAIRLSSAASTRMIHGPALPSEDELYDKVAKYPEIDRFRNETEKAEHKTRTEIKALKTVEEKQYFVNLPKYFGWRTFLLDASYLPPSCLPSVQFLTNTTLVDDQLPDVYKSLDVSKEAEELVPLIKSAIVFHKNQHQLGENVLNDKMEFHEHFAKSDLYKILAFKRNQPLVLALNRIIMAKLRLPHLMDANVDHQPRNEAFWFRGPIDPVNIKMRQRQGVVDSKYNKASRTPKTKEWAESQEDHPCQFLGPYIHAQLRCSATLDPILSLDDPIVKTGPVPKHDYFPGQSGWTRKRRYGTNLNGSWTGTNTSFSHLVIADDTNFYDKCTTETAWSEESEHNQRQDVVLSKVVLNGFGMTFAEACNQGFSPFNDPTRPFVGQVAVTNGQRWKLGVYQLNKMAMQGISETNDEMLRNVCWHLPEEELYSQSGDDVDVNLDLLQNILKFYALKPSADQIPNAGYLDDVKDHVYKLKNDYNREQFHINHRFMYSNRPRHFTKNYGEILWHQRLFMIKHPEFWQPIGHREKPWFVRAKYDKRGREFWHPEHRRFDNHPGHYVPKKFREYHEPNTAKVISAPIPPDDE